MKYKYDVDLQLMGSHIQKARKSAGLSQKQLAEILGIDDKYLSAIECGTACPSYPLMMAICDQLNLCIHYITWGRCEIIRDEGSSGRTMFYVPEAGRLNERQCARLLKLFRLIAEQENEESLQ